MKLVKSIERSKSFWFLVFASFIFFVLRLPSVFEPYWHADEGIYQAVGMLLRAGHPLYSGGWENKTPLLLALYALFNSDQYVIRAVSMLFGISSLWFFYYVAKHLFHNSNKLAGISSLLYTLLFATPLIEGNIANAENFMLLPVVLGAYLITTHHLSLIKQRGMLFVSGILLSLAFLTKIVAVFDFAAFGFYLLATSEGLRLTVKEKILPYVVGFLVPVALTFLFFIFTNNFKDFLNALILQNVGYVAQGNSFLLPNGLLYLKLILLGVFCFFVYFQRHSFSKNSLFVLIWFAFALFNAFFSGRPYDHYLILMIPSFSLLIGLIISDRKWGHTAFIFLIVSLIIILRSFNPHWEILSYYNNYLKFVTGHEDVVAYRSFFDPNTPRDYELASYIKMNTNSSDSIYVWGTDAQLYKLTDKVPITRYVVGYHATYFPTGIAEMRKAIAEKKPKLIIIVHNFNTPFPAPLINYREVINIQGAIVYEKIY